RQPLGPRHAAPGGLRARARTRAGLPPGPAAPPGAVLPRLRRRPADLQLARPHGWLSLAPVRPAAGAGGGRIHPGGAARPACDPAGAVAAGGAGGGHARGAAALELRRPLPVPRQQLRGGVLEAAARRVATAGGTAAAHRVPERAGAAPAPARR